MRPFHGSGETTRERGALPLLAAVSWLVILLLGGVVGVRGVQLARHGWQPTAPGEARWLAWAGGNEWERAALEALPATLPSIAGEAGLETPIRTVEVRVTTPGPTRPDWLRVRAQYRWPAVRVVTATVVDAETGVEARDGPAGAGSRRIAVTVTPAMAAAVGEAGPTRRAGFGRWLLALLGALGLSTLAWWLGRRQERAPRMESAPGGRARRLGALGVLAGAVTVWLVRLGSAPLWSWDHHAIWGMKARRIAALGLESDLLAGPAFTYSAGQYPLGWPLLLAVAGLATGDGLPGPTLFRWAHGLVGCGVILLVALAVARCGARLWVAAAAAAWTALSPLLWDTESLGLADLPLAAVALAAFYWLSGGDERGSPPAPSCFHLALAGVALGLLPWVKPEGWVLALGMVGVVGLPAAGRAARDGGFGSRLWPFLALLLPAGLLAVTSRVPVFLLGGGGTGFLTGDWASRLVARSEQWTEILGRLGAVLSDPAWLGLWWLAPGTLLVLLVRGLRHRCLGAAAGLAGVVVLQLIAYGGVYMATYLDPLAHIDSSFLRIAAALVPLMAVATACAWPPAARDDDGDPGIGEVSAEAPADSSVEASAGLK